MDKPTEDFVTTYLRRSVATLERAAGDEKFHRTLRTIADLIETAFRSGNKLMLAGNGGSAGRRPAHRRRVPLPAEFRPRAVAGHCAEHRHLGAHRSRQ